MRKTLLVAADVDRSLIDRAMDDGRFEVVYRPVRSEEELAVNVADAHILVTRAYNRVTQRVLEAAPRLELIAQGTSGIDNIDADTARARGIAIVSLPGANANAVAELVIGFILSMTRTIPQYTREVARGLFSRDDCATRHEMRHYALGIVGLGQVGMRVARLARAFDMKVRAYDPYLIDSDFADRGAERVRTLAELLGISDVLTLHVPLNAETRGMIGEAEIRALRRGSFLINAARGGVLDQRAALASLADDHLGGLALDVFDPEPPVEPLPDDPRLVLTPHVAGCSFECKREIGAVLYERIVEHFGF
ncbi:MAG TPA: NAD(P)-dependent oxidoreductase [Thermoanaerobaculia bacterium]|nr:NAD(P)-dependent oxidoreductase [Thermoanaerobaculia bacterium]